MKAPLRTFLGALTAAVLVLAQASGECISCPTSLSASERNGNCCTKDGRCNTSHHKSPSDGCLKEHNSEVALVKQGAPVYPVITASTLEVTQRIDTVRSLIQAPAPLTTTYSPPEPYLLNSALLI